MLKLKHGQEIKQKNGGALTYVVEVLENSILLNSKKDCLGSNYWYTNEYFLGSFVYIEPFEPKEGECVWFLRGATPAVVSGSFNKENKYLFNRFFKTQEEAREFCAKVNAL